MASYLEGLFADYVDPELLRLKQQQQFTQNLAQSTDPRQFIATVGSNMGQQLAQGAQGLFGGPSNQEQLGQVLRNAKGNTQAERMQSIADQLSRMPGMERQAMAAAAEATRLKSAEFEANNKTRNVYRTVKKPVLDKITGKPTGDFYEDNISVTEYYNPRTGQWEEKGGVSSASSNGAGVTESQAKDAIKDVNKTPQYDKEEAARVLNSRPNASVVAPAGGAVNPIVGTTRDVAGRTLGPAGLPDQQLPSASYGVPGRMDTPTGRPANVAEGDVLGMLIAERGRAMQRGDISSAAKITEEINAIRRKFR